MNTILIVIWLPFLIGISILHTPGYNLIYQQNQLKIIKACYAHNFIGQEAIVEGKIVGVYRSPKGHIFLNFEQAYPHQCFTAVIFSSAMKNFNGYVNEKTYLNRTVQVSGFIKEYKGKPEIIVNYPEQIKVLK